MFATRFAVIFFDKTKFAYRKADEWSKKEEEFIKRAGFVLMACLAVHDKDAADKKYKERSG